jgi:hypothetical protein
LMESSGCKSRTAKASMQAGSECCHSLGDWWVRSVHSKEAGREDSAAKTRLIAMPTLLTRRKAASGRPIQRGRAGVAGVPSSGHASKGIPQEPRRARHLWSQERKRDRRETRGDRIRVEEQSYDPVVPVKVGNRRASGRSGHGTHWRKGGNRCTYLTKGNIDEAQTSTHYVHTNRQNIRTSQGGSEPTILFDRSSDHA